MSMKSIVKSLILTFLPEKALQIIKKVYFVRALRFSSEKDEPDFKIVRHLVNPGNFVVDIGANIGIYTKYLSELVGSSGRVYSLEPVPNTFAILSSNMKKLGLRNVALINCAISDAQGSAQMEIPRYTSGGENYYQARIVSEISSCSSRHVSVKIKTIDSLFSELKYDVCFIKCDVEGHELECIIGGYIVDPKSRTIFF